MIGGGIAGLASAALLARDGYRVTLLEKQESVGGRAGEWAQDGFRFDTGPSWYLMPEVFDHFFRLLGTTAAEQLDLRVLDPGYRVFFEDGSAPVDVRRERRLNEELFERLEPGAGDRLGAYLDSARKTYELAKRHFLYTSFASVRPLLTAEVLRGGPKLARLLLESLDTWAGRHVSDPRLRQILGYPAVFLGSAPKLAPSMYHLMSHLDLADGVLYPQGGFTRLIRAIAGLAEGHGARIITGVEATAILTERSGTKARAFGVRYRDAAGAEHTLAADAVVSAADLHHTETALLPRHLQSYPERYWRRRVPGPGAVLLMLGVEGALPELAHHSLMFTADWDANFAAIFGRPTKVPEPASIYVCRPSATDPSAAPPGHENLFVLVPVPADPVLGAGGVGGTGSERVERLADTVIGQIADWAGIPDLASRIRLRRTVGPADFARDFNSWRGGVLGPAHTLRQSAFLRGSNKSRRVEGLFYAGGTTIPGIGLPMCLISAEILLKRLRGDITTAALPEPLEASGGAGQGSPADVKAAR
ncbi:phytoene desaturase family protein [Crystallibacter crystallopoietes]|nr:phytoene desaturase family protein [Arthrobacter crystallopoietes]